MWTEVNRGPIGQDAPFLHPSDLCGWTLGSAWFSFNHLQCKLSLSLTNRDGPQERDGAHDVSGSGMKSCDRSAAYAALRIAILQIQHSRTQIR